MRRLLLCAIHASALLWAVVAQAHGDEVLAGMRAAHGGQLQASGSYHLELLVEKGQVQVWVTDHASQEQTTSGASGSVMLIYPSGTVTVPLLPAGSNKLAGRDARVTPNPDTRVALILTMLGQQQPVQSKFLLKAKGGATPAHHASGVH